MSEVIFIARASDGAGWTEVKGCTEQDARHSFDEVLKYLQDHWGGYIYGPVRIWQSGPGQSTLIAELGLLEPAYYPYTSTSRPGGEL